jgi:hypothetical protein
MRTPSKKLVLLLAVFILAGPISMGQTPPPPPDKVEEDWQLVIATPDPTNVGPQITTCMSPVSDNSTPFVAFDLNYRDFPSFQPGGMLVEVYDTQGNILQSDSQGSDTLQTPNETITWTQRLHYLGGGSLLYKVLNGQSTTWGQFGVNQGLDPVSFNASITSLSGYKPDTSVAKSGVTWQSNRVTSMTLLRVRYYSNGVLISTDNTPRSITLGQ